MFLNHTLKFTAVCTRSLLPPQTKQSFKNLSLIYCHCGARRLWRS